LGTSLLLLYVGAAGALANPSPTTENRVPAGSVAAPLTVDLSLVLRPPHVCLNGRPKERVYRCFGGATNLASFAPVVRKPAKVTFEQAATAPIWGALAKSRSTGPPGSRTALSSSVVASTTPSTPGSGYEIALKAWAGRSKTSARTMWRLVPAAQPTLRRRSMPGVRQVVPISRSSRWASAWTPSTATSITSPPSQRRSACRDGSLPLRRVFKAAVPSQVGFPAHGVLPPPRRRASAGPVVTP
jgi:hypothetical protein